MSARMFIMKHNWDHIFPSNAFFKQNNSNCEVYMKTYIFIHILVFYFLTIQNSIVCDLQKWNTFKKILKSTWQNYLPLNQITFKVTICFYFMKVVFLLEFKTQNSLLILHSYSLEIVKPPCKNRNCLHIRILVCSQPGFEYELYKLPAVGPLGIEKTSLEFCFFICRVKTGS